MDFNPKDKDKLIDFDPKDKDKLVDFDPKDQEKLILHNETIIWIFSIVDGKLQRKKVCRTPEDYRLVGISKNGKAYLLSDNYIYESSGWIDVEIIVPTKQIFVNEYKVIKYIRLFV